MVFQKKIALEYHLSHISGKDHGFFPRKYDLNLRRKMKDDLSQKKNTWKYDIFFMPSEKMVFSKGAAPWNGLSCIIWKDGIFFSKTRYFFLGQEASDDPPQEIHGNMIFSASTYECYKLGVTPLCPKKSRMVLSCKNTSKVIDVLDWHPGKSSSNFLYFHGDLYGRFHVLLSSEKNQET